MAYELIKVLRAEGIEYVVAPYEADAQLAFLEREGMIDGIITEDSDLLVFGCKTVLFKLDTYGNCVELQQARLANAKQVSFEGWGAAEFRQMAILSGCDYLPSIVGMGLKNAHKLLRRYESAEKVVQALRLEGKMSVPLGYEDAFRRAEFTFMHQRVWDPRGNGCLATLTPLPQDAHEHLLAFIGAPMAWEEARAVAKGELCPIAKTPLGGAPLAAPPLKSAQPSLRSFFAQEKRPTPRKVLGELDANVAFAHATPVRATTPARAPVAPAPARTPVASAPAHPAPVPCATPAPLACAASKFFTPKADVSTDASSLFDRSASSDGVHTPQTSSQGSPCSSPPSPKNTWKEGVSSPVSSPTHSPVAPPTHLPNTPALRPAAPLPNTPALRPPPKRPATSPGLALQMDDDGADENDAARRSAWFKRFSFSGPRTRAGPPTDPGLRTAAAPRRAVSDATPTRMQAQAPTTPRLPLASKRAATPADSAHVKRVHVDLHDTPAPASGSAKLLQFRYKEK